MSHLPALRAAAALLLAAAGGAQAASVTCQSRNEHREDCWLRGRGEVVLVRQISSTRCVKGRNWDETRNGLYVTDGCGGVFETRDSGGWTGRPDNRPDHRPDDRPGNRPGDRPGNRPGDRPGANVGRVREAAAPACAARFNNEGNGAPTVEIDGERRVRSDQWDLMLRIDGRRYVCRVDDRGRVLSVNPA
jgi:hypothetical protein